MARKGSGWVTLAIANSLVLLTVCGSGIWIGHRRDAVYVSPHVWGHSWKVSRGGDSMLEPDLSGMSPPGRRRRPGASGGALLCVTVGYSTWPGLVQAWWPQLITFHTG